MNLRFTLDGSRPVSTEVGTMVCALATCAGLDGKAAYRLRLATDEIVTNIVVHGYHSGGGPISLSYGFDATRAWVEIEDEAPLFDPRQHDPLPRLAAGTATGRVGGFGLFLAMRSLDDFRYRYTGRRNHCVLTVLR
ncbi:ATP-binding protein [Actinacidiphila sp. bgisy167]|uniref:ATP-binding protein n=1 Tax=Actinacidiphila sp. bgisy167 TaxID=3413797 RepID=UPI003D725735